ncbi:MAG: lysophospholipid acyltransferase family protein [Lentisphaeraceae bacterium]|nr:lysophospholipid acyltransferase family protein [Lentisphaeraceae bacterium]
MVQEPKHDVDIHEVLGRKSKSRISFLKPLIERATGLSKVKKVYNEDLSHLEEGEFIDQAIQKLKVNYSLNKEQLANIPQEGPVILVANHPFGVHDSLLLSAILREARPDYKIMANSFFSNIRNMHDKLILVDAFDKQNRQNVRPLKESVKFLKSGGALGVFPAGSVSHLEFNNRHFTDSEWSETIAGLVELTGATVVPIYFSGRNSIAFNLAGLLHDKLRTAFLARELMKRKEEIQINIGAPIKADYLKKMPNRRQMVDYLKMRCYLLADQGSNTSEAASKTVVAKSAVVEPLLLDELVNEINSLPSECHLLDYKDCSVFCARAKQIPNALYEIGRLREVTFREVEEGTGKDIDLDEYDETYLHLFIWHRENKEIVGAYRMGEVDLLTKKSLSGLYTSNFYKFDQDFINDHKMALEMGRSFIRKEYQRKPFSLLLLWRGICSYVARNPQYRFLFGAVSMSDEYDPKSRALTAALLLDRQCQLEAKTPVNIKLNSEIKSFCSKYHFDKSEDLSELVRGIEDDGKDIPVLIKQYMKLGGRFHSFCVDPDFGNTLDGLIVVDLPNAPTRNLKQYMGDATEGYLAHHNR